MNGAFVTFTGRKAGAIGIYYDCGLPLESTEPADIHEELDRLGYECPYIKAIEPFYGPSVAPNVGPAPAGELLQEAFEDMMGVWL